MAGEGSQEAVGEPAVVGPEPQTDGPVELAEGAGDQLGQCQHHRAVPAMPAHEQVVDLPVVAGPDPHRWAIRNWHVQGGRVEGGDVVVGTGSEAEPVVVPLVEYPQGGHGGAVGCCVGQRASDERAGQALAPGHMAGGDKGDRRQVEVDRRGASAVTHRPGRPLNDALGRSVEVGDHGAADGQYVGQRRRLRVGVVDPAHLPPDAGCGTQVVLGLVGASGHGQVFTATTRRANRVWVIGVGAAASF